MRRIIIPSGSLHEEPLPLGRRSAPVLRTRRHALSHIERLRDVARFYLRVCEATSDPKSREHYADCALEFAQMAEAFEREENDAANMEYRNPSQGLGLSRPRWMSHRN